MNIQKIHNISYNTQSIESQKNSLVSYQSNFGIKLATPLAHDVVVFKAKGPKKGFTAEVRAALARQQARRMRDAKLREEANTEPTKKTLSGDIRKEFLNQYKLSYPLTAPAIKLSWMRLLRKI